MAEFELTDCEDVEPSSIEADDTIVISDVAVFRIEIATEFEVYAASFKEVNKLEETAELDDLVAIASRVKLSAAAAFDTGSKVLIEEMSPGVEPILILLSSVFRDVKIEYDLDLLKSIRDRQSLLGSSSSAPSAINNLSRNEFVELPAVPVFPFLKDLSSSWLSFESTLSGEISSETDFEAPEAVGVSVQGDVTLEEIVVDIPKVPKEVAAAVAATALEELATAAAALAAAYLLVNNDIDQK